MKRVLDLAWGDPVVVRQALRMTLGKTHPLRIRSFDDTGYPVHEGSPKLIEQLKELAYKQSGHRPKHLVVTCGATGGIHAALHALKHQIYNAEFIVTNKRYFPFYSYICHIADLIQIDKEEQIRLSSSGISTKNFISLTDSPSNPEGLVFPFDSVDAWDGAYAASHYSKGGHVPTKWRVMVGSLSKTLGLSGLRIGWVSTDEDELYWMLTRYVINSYCGLPASAMDMAEEVLDELDQDSFGIRARDYLDNNREEVQKLLDRFGQGSIPARGMFAILQLGNAERRALMRAGIKWQPGSTWGENEDWARLSLGQSREIVREAVKGALR